MLTQNKQLKQSQVQKHNQIKTIAIMGAKIWRHLPMTSF